MWSPSFTSQGVCLPIIIRSGSYESTHKGATTETGPSLTTLLVTLCRFIVSSSRETCLSGSSRNLSASPACLPPYLLRVDSKANAHSESVVMAGSDWMGLMDQFRAWYGEFLHDNTLPSQSYTSQTRRRYISSILKNSQKNCATRTPPCPTCGYLLSSRSQVAPSTPT